MSWFQNLKTRTKLLFAFGLICGLIAGLGWFSVSRLGTVNGSTVEIAQSWLPSVRVLGEVNKLLSDIRIAEVRGLLSEGADVKQQMELTMNERIAKLKKLEEEYQPLISSTEERNIYNKFREDWEAYIVVQKKLLEISKAGNAGEKLEELLTTDSKPVFDKATATIQALVDLNQVGADKASAHASSTFASSRTLLLSAIGGILVIACILALVIARAMSAPLVRAVEVLRKVAAGDFTTRLGESSKDEIGQLSAALDEAVGNMQGALKDVRDVSEQLTSAAQQLSSASEEISSGAQEQASSLEETSANLEQMTATVKQSADNARQASQLAGGSRASAEKGGEVVGQAVSAMGEINQSSKQIAEIITTIDEIAFQTNLLALNAAVEAARAGEQGRGFAVVAAEVRNLAQRSASSAKEIKGMIQDSVRKVEGGTALVDRSGQTLSEIVASVRRVTDIVEEMASASREQATGIDQVNKAISQMDQVTQANAAQTEEMSSTAQSLAGQAEQLRELIGKFRLDSDARVTRSAPKAAPPPARAAAARAPVRWSKPKKVRAVRASGTDGEHNYSEAPSNGHNGHSNGVSEKAMDDFMAAAAADGFKQA